MNTQALSSQNLAASAAGAYYASASLRCASAAGTAAAQTRGPGLPLTAWLSGALLLAFVAWVLVSAFGAGAAPSGMPAVPGMLRAHGALTLCVFAIAIWLWMFARVDDTYVALGAATALVMMGVVRDTDLFVSLGEDTVWLLLGAFLIAAGVSASGLATRVAAFVVIGARTPAQLVHLSTAALVATAFMVPATSGRAALTLPVFVALAGVLGDRPALVRALALLFPSVILLSAVASYLGAGAHLIANQILQAAGTPGFTFASWLKFGLPLAVLASHACAVLVLWLFVPRAERRAPLRVTLAHMQQHADTPLSGPLAPAQMRAVGLVGLAMLMWCTEPLHGLHPAVVALACGLVMTHPSIGAVTLPKALKSVPWSLLMFMAATLTLGTALVNSGAADWLAAQTLGSLDGSGQHAGLVFVAVLVGLSTMAHLVIQSRSARSAVLIPIVIALAPGVGVSPAAAALTSTAAAGFCHTLTSSAKPMTLYSSVSGVPTYTPADLLRLSAWLAPLSAALVLLFALLIWPWLGLPLFVR